MSDSLTLYVDGAPLPARPGQTIAVAAAAAGVVIPTLCGAGQFRDCASCMVCAVYDCRLQTFVPACSTAVTDGLAVESATAAVRHYRRTVLELMLSQHSGDCQGPCRRACPEHFDIPEFLRAPEQFACRPACEQCPARCEKACRLKLSGRAPVPIRALLLDSGLPVRSVPPAISAGGYQHVLPLSREVRAQLAEQPGEGAHGCLECQCRRSDDCRLRELASEYGADHRSMARLQDPELKIWRGGELCFDPDKCVLCGKCVAFLQQRGIGRGLCLHGRGRLTRVSAPLGLTLPEALAACPAETADLCPTGALTRLKPPPPPPPDRPWRSPGVWLALLLWLAVAACAPAPADKAASAVPPPPCSAWPQFGGDAGQTRQVAAFPPGADRPPVLRWTYKNPAGVSPAVTDGTLVVVGGGNGALQVLALADGARQWELPLSGQPLSAPPLLHQGRAYAADDGGQLFCVDLGQRRLLWQRTFAGKIRGGATLAVRTGAADVLLCGTYANEILVLSAQSGESLLQLEGAGFVNGSPAVSGNLAFFADCGGQLTPLDLAALRPLQPLILAHHLPASPVCDGSLLLTALHSDGLRAFALPGLQPLPLPELEEAGPFPTQPALSPRGAAIAGSRGTVIWWERDSPTLQLKKIGDKNLAPLLGPEHLLLTTETGKMLMLALPSLDPVWQIDLKFEFIEGPAFYGRGLLLSDADGNLFAFEWR